MPVRVIKARRMRWVGHVTRTGVKGYAYKVLVGKTEGKRSLRRREDNIRMDLRELGREVEDWMHLAEDRHQWWALVNTVVNLGFCKGGELSD
jgi:hypothetical protein